MGDAKGDTEIVRKNKLAIEWLAQQPEVIERNALIKETLRAEYVRDPGARSFSEWLTFALGLHRRFELELGPVPSVLDWPGYKK